MSAPSPTHWASLGTSSHAGNRDPSWHQEVLQTIEKEANRHRHLLRSRQVDTFVTEMAASFPMPPWLIEPQLSVQHLNELLDLSETASAFTSQQMNTHIVGLRSAFRHKVIGQYAQNHPGSINQWARVLQDVPFPGMTEILARCVAAHFADQLTHMDQSQALLELLASTTPKRWVTSDLRNANEALVAAHNLQLLRLEYPLQAEIAEQFTQALGVGNASSMAVHNILMRAVHQREPAKYPICRLLEHFGPHQSNSAHNVHPASMLLAEVTGFVMHPTSKEQVLCLAAPTTPNGIRQFSSLFISKYLNAVQRDQVHRFVSEAFCLSNPCFEAAAEHLLQLDLAKSNYQTQPCPKWSNLVSVEQNADTMVEWVAHTMLAKFARHKQLRLEHLSHAEIDQMLCSKPYVEFMVMHQQEAVTLGLSKLDSSMHGAVFEAFLRYFSAP